MIKGAWQLKLGYILICMLTFVGLIVHAKVHLIEPWFYTIFEDNVYIDFFSYYKALFLRGVIAIASMLLLINLINNKQDIQRFHKKEFYVIFAMMLIAIMSTVFSKYPQVALNGSIERYEGLWVWLSYLAIPFLTVYFIRTRQQLDSLLRVLLIPAFLIMGIGALQYFGQDIYQMDWIKYVLFTDAQREMIRELKVTASGVFTTLFNQNYVGSFAVLTVPLMIYQVAKSIEQRKYHWTLLAIAGLGVSGISLLGAYSSGGYVAVALAVLMMLVLVVFKKSGWLLKGISLFFLVIAFIAGSYVYQTNEKLRAQLDFGDVFSQDLEEIPVDNERRQILDIITEGHEVRIVTSKESFTLKDENQNLKFLDENGVDLIMQQYKDTQTFVAVDEKYKGYRFDFYLDDDILEILVDGRKIPVLLNPDGLRIAGIRKLPITPTNAEYFGFEGYEDFGSSRGYIWSRTLPLLKEYKFIGHGADTFAFVFPQSDVARLNQKFWSNFNFVVDKPHNTYLQSAVQFGVFFAILQTIILCWISLRLLLQKWTASGLLGIAIFSTIFGFAIISLVNDSIVSVSPYFWLVLGLGIVVNHQNQLFPRGD